jgi:hypothetical protein
VRNEAKKEYVAEVRERYFNDSRHDKTNILNELCKVCKVYLRVLKKRLMQVALMEFSFPIYSYI